MSAGSHRIRSGAPSVFVVGIVILRTVLARARHRRLLSLLAAPYEGREGTMTLDHPSPVAYCLPGIRPRIVKKKLFHVLHPDGRIRAPLREDGYLIPGKGPLSNDRSMGGIPANASPQRQGFRLGAIEKEPSARLAADLARRCKVAPLGTLHHGVPSVSMVPYAIIEDPLAFGVLVSALSAHTKEMLGEPNVALMIMEPETDTKPPHALARVSMQGRAEPIAQGDSRFGAARAAYSARFPDMVRLFELGDFTLFGPAVQIYTPMHPMNAELRRKQEYGKPVEIGSDVWVGGGAMICPGVTIGSKSVIGAGSVVTRSVPDGVFAAGNPCRVIREIRE